MNNEENKYLLQTLIWLREQKNRAIKTAFNEWPDDYKFIAELALWFEQITDAIRNHQPVDNVRRVIVQEDIRGNAIDIDYEYYTKDDPEIGKTAFCTTTLIK